MHRIIIDGGEYGYQYVYARDETGQWWRESGPALDRVFPVSESDVIDPVNAHETAKRLTLKEGREYTYNKEN